MHVSQDLAAQQLVEPACFGQFSHSNLRWRMKAKTSRNKFQTLSQKWNTKVSLRKMIFYQFPLIFIACAKHKGFKVFTQYDDEDKHAVSPRVRAYYLHVRFGKIITAKVN